MNCSHVFCVVLLCFDFSELKILNNEKLLGKYVTLAGFIDLTLFDASDADEFEDINVNLQKIYANVLLYYSEGPRTPIIVNSDQTVKRLIVIMYKVKGSVDFRQKFDPSPVREDYLHAKNNLKVLLFPNLTKTLSISFNPSLRKRKTRTLFLVAGNSHISFRINLIRNGKYINTQFIEKYMNYKLSAQFINSLTGKKLRPKKRCIRSGRNADTPVTISYGELHSGEDPILIKCTCPHIFKCSERFSTFKYDPGRYEISVNQENSFIHGEEAGILKVTLMSKAPTVSYHYTIIHVVKITDAKSFSIQNDKFKFTGLNQISIKYDTRQCQLEEYKHAYFKVVLLIKESIFTKLIKVYFFAKKPYIENISFFTHPQYAQIDNFDFKQRFNKNDEYMVEEFSEVQDHEYDIDDDFYLYDSFIPLHLPCSCLVAVVLSLLLLSVPLYA